MDQVFKDIYKKIWEEVFVGIEPLDMEKFKSLYTKDIPLPVAYKSNVTGKDVFYSDDYGYKKFVEPEASKDMEFFRNEKKGIESLADVMRESQELALFKGSRITNSDVVVDSDNIYSSNMIFNSGHLHSCQKSLWCYNSKASEYMMASKGNGECSFGIRLLDSGGVSNSFDIHWSGKSSNCYFCHDSYDLRDCMFCFHIASKQFCIANMQFEEAEYHKIKEKILKDYFAQLDSENAFVTLADL